MPITNNLNNMDRNDPRLNGFLNKLNAHEGFYEYTVQRGDTLRKIVARQYGLNEANDAVKISNLVKIITRKNRLRNGDSIQTGNKLYLPKREMPLLLDHISDKNINRVFNDLNLNRPNCY